MGNGVSKELISVTQEHEQRWGECLRGVGLAGWGKRGKLGQL